MVTHTSHSLLLLGLIKRRSPHGDRSRHIRAQNPRLLSPSIPSAISPDSIKNYLHGGLFTYCVSLQHQLNQVLVNPVMGSVLLKAGKSFDKTVYSAFSHVGCGCTKSVEDGGFVLNPGTLHTQRVHPCTNILLLYEPSPPPHCLSASVVDPIFNKVEDDIPVLDIALSLLPPHLEPISYNSVIKPIKSIDTVSYLLNLSGLVLLFYNLLVRP